MTVARTLSGKIITVGGHALKIVDVAPAPVSPAPVTPPAGTPLAAAGMVQSFDYLPSRDGVGLGTAWAPRFPNEMRPKGGDNIYNGEFQWYADPAYPWSNGFSPFAVANGALRIRAQRTADLGFQPGEIPNDPATGAPYGWVSGILSSFNTFSQQGGYFEAEIQFPKGVGPFPAFWMLPLGAHPPEIDIAEYRGQLPNQYHVNAIAIAGQDDFYTPDGADLSAAFHRYGLAWTDTTLTFYLDGAVVTTRDISTKPEFGQPFYVLLNLAVGTRGLGGFIPAPDSTTPDPMDMLVRSLRAWQRPGPVSVTLSAASYPDTVPAGGAVATIATVGFGGSTGHVVTIVSDLDAAFSVDGLTLRRTAVAGSSHQVRLRVTDSAGRTLERLFSLAVIASLPASGNLLTSTDLSGPAWIREGVTAPAPDTLREQSGNGGHDVLVSAAVAKPGTAGRYLWSMDATAQGTPWVQVQIFASSGSSTDYGTSSIAWFNMAGGAVGYVTGIGGWSNVQATVTPLGGGVQRLQVAFTTGTETGMVPLLRLATGQDGSNYAGDPAAGMRLDGLWLGLGLAPS